RGSRKHGAFCYGGMLAYDAFDLHRGNIFAAPADRVLNPVDEIEVPCFVIASGIAGMQPQISPHLGTLPPLIPVAAHRYPRLPGPQENLANRASRNEAVVLVSYHDLVFVVSQPADDLFVRNRRAERHKNGCATLG